MTSNGYATHADQINAARHRGRFGEWSRPETITGDLELSTANDQPSDDDLRRWAARPRADQQSTDTLRRICEWADTHHPNLDRMNVIQAHDVAREAVSELGLDDCQPGRAGDVFMRGLDAPFWRPKAPNAVTPATATENNILTVRMMLHARATHRRHAAGESGILRAELPTPREAARRPGSEPDPSPERLDQLARWVGTADPHRVGVQSLYELDRMARASTVRRPDLDPDDDEAVDAEARELLEDLVPADQRRGFVIGLDITQDHASLDGARVAALAQQAARAVVAGQARARR